MKPTIYHWKPTACDCEIYQYMDENGDFSYVTPDQAQELLGLIHGQYPENTKTPAEWAKTRKNTKFCPDHEGLEDGSELGGVLRDEDVRKSKINRELTCGVEYSWTGKKKDRKLKVKLLDATQEQKEAIESFCHNNFESGKVEIDG